MVRPKKAIGRDRTRSISLDGDVAEIAENLASKNLLSRTLLELLRNAYGFPSEKERAEALLFEATSARKEAQAKEEEALRALEEIHATEQAKALEVETALKQQHAVKRADLQRRINALKSWMAAVDDPEALAEKIALLEDAEQALAELDE